MLFALAKTSSHPDSQEESGVPSKIPMSPSLRSVRAAVRERFRCTRPPALLHPGLLSRCTRPPALLHPTSCPAAPRAPSCPAAPDLLPCCTLGSRQGCSKCRKCLGGEGESPGAPSAAPPVRPPLQNIQCTGQRWDVGRQRGEPSASSNLCTFQTT